MLLLAFLEKINKELKYNREKIVVYILEHENT
jgi:hypothetical protein